MVQHILQDHPLVGIGFGNFRLRFYEYYPLRNHVLYTLRIPDNMYLTILSETGTIGFMGFLLFILFLFKKAYRKMRILNGASKERQRLLLVLSALVGLLVNMAGYELFYWPNLYIYFCILIGLVEASCRSQRA